MLTKQAELAAIHSVQSAIDREGLDWVAGETSISRLSPDEKARLYNAKVGPPIAGVPIESRPLHLRGVADPAYFDWRSKDGNNWVTPVKHQGTCGSCWAFSASGAIEAAFNIYSGNPNLNIDISEQHVVSDCCHETRCGNCGGGWPDWTLKYCRDWGIPDEACFPYIARDCACDTCDDVDERRFNITGYKYITSRTDDFKWALQEYGPMAVVITHPDDWFYYTSGVYKPTVDAVGWATHAVLLVGWDDSLGDNGAWICKNSHGTGFGEDGYALVDFGVLEGYNYAYAITGIVEDDYPVDTRCTDPTDHFTSGCDLLLHYDADGDGTIDALESIDAMIDHSNGIITDAERIFVNSTHASNDGQIDMMCPGCYSEDENVAPTAIASATPTFGTPPLSVQFTGQGTDPDGSVQSYNWDFGDGNVTNIQNPLHTYSNIGAYSPALTVTDNDGATGTDRLTILVTKEEDLGIGGWISPSAVIDVSSQSGGHQPPNAIDNNRDTKWLSVYGDSPSYITFDLGAQVIIDSIRAISYYRNVPNIYISNDASNWTLVGSIRMERDVYGVAEFTTVSTRYIKLERPSGTGYFSCTEMQVFAPTGTGWFKPKFAVSSSDHDSTYTAENAIDGFFEGGTDCWFSRNEVPCWIRFDLGLEKTFDAVRIVSPNDPLPMTLVVEVSSDNISWTPVTSDVVINDSYTEIEVAITQSSARYVRLNIVSANNFGACCEFDVHVVDDTVANIEVVSFTATPLLCQTPCNVDVSITWANTGTASATFTPGYTVDGTLYSSLSITLAPGQQGTLNETLTAMLTGSYEICPVPN